MIKDKGINHKGIKDFSKVSTPNPTRTIEEHYDLLMSETCPDKLTKDVVELVEKYGGVSERNLARFKVTLRGLAGDLKRIREYITNFMLAGSGLGVVGGHRRYC